MSKNNKVLEQVQSLLRPKKIGVCTSWGSPFVWMHGAYNMMNLEHPKGVGVRFFPGHGRDPARRHMWGVEKALEWGATHICFLGADQVHDEDILVKFAKHCEDGWAATAGMVPVRGWVPSLEKAFGKVAWKWKDDVNRSGAKLNMDFFEPVFSTGPEYEEIAITGSGALMFDVNCLHLLKKPWFIEAPPNDDASRMFIMDTMFVFRLVTQGHARILLDKTIFITHLEIFAIDETYGDRFYDYPKEQEEVQRKYFNRDMQQSGPSTK